jgi:hypothetical protein
MTVNAYARNVKSIHLAKDGHRDGRLTFDDYGRKQTISNPSDVLLNGLIRCFCRGDPDAQF